MDAKEKRPYQKPTIEQSTLLGDETTVAGCKQNTGGGMGSVLRPCTQPPQKCRNINGS